MNREDAIGMLSLNELDQEVSFSSEEGNQIYEGRVTFKVHSLLNILFDEIEDLKEKVQSIKLEQNHYIRYKFDNFSKDEAEKRILAYLKQMKKETKQISVFEISQSLCIAADLVEEILEALEKKNKVKLM